MSVRELRSQKKSTGTNKERKMCINQENECKWEYQKWQEVLVDQMQNGERNQRRQRTESSVNEQTVRHQEITQRDNGAVIQDRPISTMTISEEQHYILMKFQRKWTNSV